MSFQNKPTSVTSYDLAALFLHTRGKPVPRKKLANNTYVERRNDSTIAVRLHNTDVVTFHQHSPYRPGASGIRAITLATGGWLTVTTKDRINTVLPWPNLRVSSNRGTWEVTLGGYSNPTDVVRFTEGITFEHLHGSYVPVERTLLPGEDQVRQDRHNTSMKRLINRYVTGLTAERLAEALSSTDNTSCTLCRPLKRIPHAANLDRERIITVGDGMGDTQHLVEHMSNGEYPFQLLYAAVAERGYIADNVVGHRDIVKRTLRTYLASRLYVGATTHPHGKRPILAEAS